MPELPEVEAWNRLLRNRGLERAIRKVELRDADTLRESLSPGEARSLLEGHRFVEARRHGKHLFARLDEGRLDEGGWLRLHFGMSGDLAFPDPDDPWPDHACLRLTFEDGGRMAYVNVRKLGQIGRVESVEGYVTAGEMGPDPLADGLSREEFRQILDGRRGMVKSTLMNQEVLSGLGNEMADEICFDAGLHPRTAVNELDEEAVDGLYRSVMRVVEAAVEACVEHPHGDAEDGRWPEEFLMPDREEGATCPRCGGSIERTEVSGRSSYFCPDHQR